MAKFHLILTLDYELFGDGSGCVDACLVQPTARAREIIEGFDGSLTLFVEALELQKIRELAPGNFTAIDRQLDSMSTAGHDLELHIHPQWMSAALAEGEWQLDFSRWRIGDLSPSEQDDCVDAGLGFLKSYGTPAVFRAGAWAIQPEGRLLETLRSRGIHMESSVAPGIHNPSEGDWFDFRRAPTTSPYWRIDTDVCMAEPGGKTLEVPIATHAISPATHFRAISASRGARGFPDGCTGTYDGPNSRLQGIYGKLTKLTNLGKVMLDFSTLPATVLIDVMRANMAKFEGVSGAVPVVAIGHNKNFSSQSASELEKFLAWAADHPDICLSSYRSWHADLVSPGTDYEDVGLR